MKLVSSQEICAKLHLVVFTSCFYVEYDWTFKEESPKLSWISLTANAKTSKWYKPLFGTERQRNALYSSGNVSIKSHPRLWANTTLFGQQKTVGFSCPWKCEFPLKFSLHVVQGILRSIQKVLTDWQVSPQRSLITQRLILAEIQGWSSVFENCGQQCAGKITAQVTYTSQCCCWEPPPTFHI